MSHTLVQDGRTQASTLQCVIRNFGVERSYLFLAHYFSVVLVCTLLTRRTGEVLRELCGFRSFSTSDCRATRESWLCFGHGGKFSFRRALAGLRCSCLPQADGTAKLHNAVIGLIARTMPYSTALGNKTEGRRRRSLGCMSQAPYPIEQLRGASLAYVGSNVLSSMVVYSPSFGLQELLHGLFCKTLLCGLLSVK